MIVAAVNYRLEGRGIQGALSQIEECLVQAKQSAADLVLFPECIILDALERDQQWDEHAVPAMLAELSDTYEAFLVQAARRHRCIVAGGTHFRRTSTGISNVAALMFPDGKFSIQTKNCLTLYEASVWRLETAQTLTGQPNTRLGVTICYDSEFPESGRSLAESGVLLQLVPAFTETEFGFNRVRLSCRARAIENQIFVAHASLVGDLGAEPVPMTFGSSAILAPCTQPFAADGVLAETELGKPGIAIAECNFDVLLTARDGGDVRNWQDRYRSGWRLERN